MDLALRFLSLLSFLFGSFCYLRGDKIDAVYFMAMASALMVDT